MILRLCVVSAVCVVLLTGCNVIGSTPEPTPAGNQWTGAPLNPPLTKPSFTLTDDQSVPFDFQADTAGKVTLLYFGYTHCPNLCPENMAMVAFALKDLPAAIRARIAVVFVTTDPRRDTPSVLATWLGKFNATFIGLTGRDRRPGEYRPGYRACRTRVARPRRHGERLPCESRGSDHRLHPRRRWSSRVL